MSTLTSPNENLYLDQNAPSLDNEQTTLAVQELNNMAFIQRFPKVERRYADPPMEMQKIGLISFIPSKGAQPNEKGVFGFAKLRGNFDNEHEASQRAEYLIRHIDSYHKIFHAYVGRPFPITVSSEYVKEICQVDLNKETTEAISYDVKKKREKEQREIEEIKERERNLMEDVKKEAEDITDYYTTLRIKKAQLTWTYAETEKKMLHMVGLIAKVRKEINDLDEQDPHLDKMYYQKYIDARKKANLPVDSSTKNTFMRYLVEDLSLPAVDIEYDRMYKKE
jgi:hypothetical protein